MNALDGFEVMDAEYMRIHRGYTGEIIDAFLETGNECMGKDYGEDAKKTCLALRGYLKKHEGLPVHVSKRGNTVLLIREGGDAR